MIESHHVGVFDNLPHYRRIKVFVLVEVKEFKKRFEIARKKKSYLPAKGRSV